MDQIEPYELDGHVEDFLNNYILEHKCKSIYNIIDILNTLNEVPDLNIDYNITWLETCIVDVITRNDNLPPTDIGQLVEHEIKKSIVAYLSAIGIEIDVVTPFYTFENILNGIWVLFTIKNEDADKLLDILNSDIDDVNKISAMLAEYTDLTVLDLYDIIKDVSQDLLNDLAELYNKAALLRNDDIHQDLKNKIVKLINIDNTFGSTIIIESISNGGYIPCNIKDNLSVMYNNILTLKDNIAMIAYEIVATIYLSNDVKNLEQDIKEYVNIDAITSIGTDQVKNDVLNFTINDIVEKIRGK